MKSKYIGKLIGAFLLAFCCAQVANAHLVAFGWKDMGNGTVVMYGQHWHGNQGSPSTANGGLRIGTWGTDPTTWQVFQWTGLINDWGGDTTANDALVTNGDLTGWATDPANWSNTNSENDWFFTVPLVIGNGSWGFFTGTACCIDTMSTPVNFTLTGISSVPPGTGPGPNQVPAPASLAFVGLALAGLAMRRRLMK